MLDSFDSALPSSSESQDVSNSFALPSIDEHHQSVPSQCPMFADPRVLVAHGAAVLALAGADTLQYLGETDNFATATTSVLRSVLVALYAVLITLLVTIGVLGRRCSGRNVVLWILLVALHDCIAFVSAWLRASWADDPGSEWEGAQAAQTAGILHLLAAVLYGIPSCLSLAAIAAPAAALAVPAVAGITNAAHVIRDLLLLLSAAAAAVAADYSNKSRMACLREVMGTTLESSNPKVALELNTHLDKLVLQLVAVRERLSHSALEGDLRRILEGTIGFLLFELKQVPSLNCMPVLDGASTMTRAYIETLTLGGIDLSCAASERAAECNVTKQPSDATEESSAYNEEDMKDEDIETEEVDDGGFRGTNSGSTPKPSPSGLLPVCKSKRSSIVSSSKKLSPRHSTHAWGPKRNEAYAPPSHSASYCSVNSSRRGSSLQVHDLDVLLARWNASAASGSRRSSCRSHTMPLACPLPLEKGCAGASDGSQQLHPPQYSTSLAASRRSSHAHGPGSRRGSCATTAVSRRSSVKTNASIQEFSFDKFVADQARRSSFKPELLFPQSKSGVAHKRGVWLDSPPLFENDASRSDSCLAREIIADHGAGGEAGLSVPGPPGAIRCSSTADEGVAGLSPDIAAQQWPSSADGVKEHQCDHRHEAQHRCDHRYEASFGSAMRGMLSCLTFCELPASADVALGSAARMLEAQVARRDSSEARGLSTWGFDVFRLSTVCTSRPVVMTGVVALRPEYEELSLPQAQVLGFLSAIEQRYHSSNEYHNAVHAADVMNNVLYFLKLRNTPMSDFDALERLAALAAAVAHDVGHNGYANRFHITAQTPLAMLYNDQSVLENLHCTLTFAVLHSEESNFLRMLDRSQQTVFRGFVVFAILETDLSRHVQSLSRFKQEFLLGGDGKQPRSSPQVQERLVPEFRRNLLAYTLKCCDVAGSAKRFDLHVQWTCRIMHEFFAQGDAESELGLPCSPFCDRSCTNISESQRGFFDFIVSPLFSAMDEYLACARLQIEVLPQMAANRDFWKEYNGEGFNYSCPKSSMKLLRAKFDVIHKLSDSSECDPLPTREPELVEEGDRSAEERTGHLRRRSLSL